MTGPSVGVEGEARQPEGKAGGERAGILLAAYGPGALAADRALALFAQLARERCPGFAVRWAFTSERLRGRLAAGGRKTDSVGKALARMAFERYSRVAVQSLHLIAGTEYGALEEEVLAARERCALERVSLGPPLLYEASDIARAAEALFAHLPLERRPWEPVVFMAHGAGHGGGSAYAALETALKTAGAEQAGPILIGAVSGEGGLDTILERLGALEHAHAEKKVWLLPLLALVGKHAAEDMAGDKSGSWRNRIETAGFSCRTVLKGLVEYEGIAEIWLEHLNRALNELEFGERQI
ncbi:MAG: sirohydrochlorin cobaltochelatase [Desulfovibrio sp.]|jgi:sirohydrochlorin cobaltochelatase|nr:sirohydrochlorin cobaltochelatase [Desulfovibrio sp.]